MHAQLSYGMVNDQSKIFDFFHRNEVFCCIASVFWVIVLLRDEVFLD